MLPVETKRRQRNHWNAVAGGWETWHEWTEHNFAPVTGWLHEAVRWRPGSRALDVGCGAGYPALAAAAALLPGGAIVATDISPEMLAAAASRARARGLGNVEFVEADAEALRLPDQSFDAVTCTYGLMFCPEPQRAVDEMHRVLKPGGRIGLVTWDAPSRSPFFGAIGGVGAKWLSLSVPGPDEPGPFRLAARDTLEAMLRASGFADIRIEAVQATFECESVDQYCQLFGDVAWKARMAALSGRDVAGFRAAVAEAVQPYIAGGRLMLGATSLCASARR
jgi:SAM-dependent methyltransferase